MNSSYCLYIEKSYTVNFNSKMKMEKHEGKTQFKKF